jgi:hypothetical protein
MYGIDVYNASGLLTFSSRNTVWHVLLRHTITSSGSLSFDAKGCTELRAVVGHVNSDPLAQRTQLASVGLTGSSVSFTYYNTSTSLLVLGR